MRLQVSNVVATNCLWLILLFTGNSFCGATSIFKRVEFGCTANNVECLSSDTYTYCVEKGGKALALRFVFNCPKNYVCEENAKYPCVREDSNAAAVPEEAKPTEAALQISTESKVLNKIIEDFISSLPSEDENLPIETNDVDARVPPVRISAQNVRPEPSNSVIILPTSKPSSGGSEIITPNPSDPSVILIPSTSLPADGSEIITPSPSSPGIIIVPHNVGPKPTILTETTVPEENRPDQSGSIIIAGNSIVGGPVFVLSSEKRVPLKEKAEIIVPSTAQPTTEPTTPPPPTTITAAPTPPSTPIIITSGPSGPSTSTNPPPIIITPQPPTVGPTNPPTVGPTNPPTVGPTNPPTVTQPTPPNCTAAGVHPGPTCTKYFECVAVWWWFEARQQDCSSGTYFNSTEGKCVAGTC